MRMYNIIEKKRNGGALTAAEIAWFVQNYTAGNLPDYQASALLMAIYFNGMTARETAELTQQMAQSGQQLDLSGFGTLTADKHSTGGVGDKTTLIVAPLAAAAGVKVAKLSGRGLGFTGGTVDKLEAIPGYRTNLSPKEFFAQVEKIGLAVAGQSGNLAPADKKLYALRDVTATVESLPLIAASIMSKKLAAGSKNIVLDVKYGSGAFMKTKRQAVALANAMVSIGQKCGRNVAALITNMNVPLGYEIGNANEVLEAAAVLQGKQQGPLKELCLALAANMVSLALSKPFAAALAQVTALLENGVAFQKMLQWVAAQGGNSSYLTNPALFQQPAFLQPVLAPAGGYLTALESAKVGECCVILGAGRSVKGDEIDPLAGITLLKHPGDAVQPNEPIALLRTNRKSSIPAGQRLFLSAVKIGLEPPKPEPLIYKTVR